ncbi:HNH endonuclease signature motif containing protein [Aquitalea aquatica]|uniref:HNH endonuclease n=1 Tax=Aquitalea aquatica TaxID=3044273 RepID=A0A838Y9T8_9NEIS|nr:HNH endonuclease signature motif containing protein [Aquitalea magnusonii]MBA4707544.1 HNH endonuclease [Aquitalea magnusonii]
MTPYGYCMCGCGQHTQLASKNDRSKGWVRGVPLKYLKGHNVVVNAHANTARAIGNKYLSSHGYVRVTLGSGLREYEHILVAEKALGRKLRNFGRGNPNTEVVHHIDGNKTNNAPSNLLVCTHRYRTELHHRLEHSPAWPEFEKVTRNAKGARHA